MTNNPYYTPAGVPATGAPGASNVMRSEFASIQSAFNLLPALTAGTAVVVNGAGTALSNTVGTLALAGNFATTGAFNTTFVQTASISLSLPAVSGLTVATLTGTETLTNKTLSSPTITGTLVGAMTIQSASAGALVVGANGSTNPVLKIDASATTVATGISVTGKAASSGVNIAAISTATDEAIRIDAKGAGNIIIGSLSTGSITLSRNTTFGGIVSLGTITGTFTSSVPLTVSYSSGGSTLVVGNNGATNPTLLVTVTNTAPSNGLNVTSTAAGSGFAMAVISSGTNENLTIDAKGSGTITLGGTSTGSIVVSRALTYGGVTLSNAVTGTGNMVLSASPTLTGTLTAAAANFSGVVTVGSQALQSGAWIGARGFNTFGSQIEFGHSNTSGYGSTIGAEFTSGFPFLAFNAEAGTTANTYRTRGLKGFVISSNTSVGALTFNTLASASADNQSLTEYLRLLQSNGHLLIGTTTDSAMLTVNGTGQFNGDLTMGGTGQFVATNGTWSPYGIISGWGAKNTFTDYSYFAATNDWRLIAGSTTVLRASTAGLGIGMTPGNVLDITQSLGGFANISLLNSNGGVSAEAAFQLQNGTHKLQMSQTGTSYITSGIFRQDGVYIIANGSAGGLTIGTYNAAQPIYCVINGAEVAQFDTSGNLLVNVTTALGSARVSFKSSSVTTLYLQNVGGAGYNVVCDAVSNAGSYYYAQFVGGTGGSIVNNGTITTYATTSDARLKNVLAEQTDYREAIKSLWIGDYEWKASGTPGFGVLAQQAYEVMPYGLGITKPANDADQWHASSEPFAHLALWGVKDLYVRTDDHETRIKALEAENRDLRAQLERKAA